MRPISREFTTVQKSRTSDNMFILNSLIRKVKYEKKTLYTCFIDFAKAFDSIWHRGLWYKLIKLGIAGNTLSCIRSMYENSTAQVKLGNGFSNVFQTGKDVLQGNNLSPLLFNLFVNDLHVLWFKDLGLEASKTRSSA
jgi:hypothetical protein